MKKIYSGWFRLVFAVLLCGSMSFFSGCSSVPVLEGEAGEKRGKEWTASCVAGELAGEDPLEPFNRSMFACRDAFMHYLVRPIGYIYGSILPMEVIKRIDYASDNLAFSSRMFGCFLQGEFKGGGVEFLRFLTNSTIGIAGFFDPADAWFGLRRRNEDFGQAFGYWNIGPGCYFILPFTASTNVRDTFGALFDKLFEVRSYIPYFGYLATVNGAVNSYDLFNSMTESCYDPYESTKILFSLMRYAHVENFHHKLEKPAKTDFGKAEIPVIEHQAEVVKTAIKYGAQNPLIDTLKSSFFRVRRNNAGWWIKTSLWNSDFIPRADTCSIRFATADKDSKEMVFQVWCQEEKPDAPLVLLLPGATGHYSAEMVRALAELYYDKGCSVAVLPNSLNPEFFLPAAMGLPGDVKTDVFYVRKALEKVIECVKKEYELTPSKIIGCGYSLGGLHMLHLAAMDENAAKPLPVDRYIAINPPADLLYALKKMDAFCRIPQSMSKKEFFNMAGDAAMKLILVSSGRRKELGILHSVNRKEEKTVPAVAEAGKKVPENKKQIVWNNPLYLPLSPEQAGWISGIYMRMGLRELLLAAHKNAPEGSPLLKTPYSWGRRTRLYREIDSYSWYSYVEKLLLPSLQKKEKELTVAELGKRASLQTIKSTLENNPKVRVLHNLDDPLLSSDDILFLDRALKKKLVWFDCGGHLGNMFLPIYRKKLLEAAFDKKSVKKIK